MTAADAGPSRLGTVHVFTGPTLSPGRVHAVLPDAVVHPPVEHGSLLELRLGRDDVVAIIDGLFYRTAPVRHKELLHVLDQGVIVLGAASMGALRAAELQPFGMRGIGVVFRLLTLGLLDGDDEVAVLHGPADQGYPQLSEALVDLRFTARRARVRGRLTTDHEAVLIDAAAGMWFGDRHAVRIVESARAAGLPPRAGDAFLSQLAEDPADVKRRDAELLLRHIRQRRWSPTAAREPTQRTWWLQDWLRSADAEVIDRVRVAHQDVLTFCQVFAEDYPEFHYRCLLGHLVATAGAGGLVPAGSWDAGDAGLRTLRASACRVARARGLLPPGATTLSANLAALLSAEERSAPLDHAVALALVRSYRCPPGMPAVEPLLALLRRHPRYRWLQQQTAAVLRLNQELAARSARYVPERIAEDRVLAMFTDRWPGGDLLRQLRDRGFGSPTEYVRRARPFAPYAHLETIPPFTLRSPGSPHTAPSHTR